MSRSSLEYTSRLKSGGRRHCESRKFPHNKVPVEGEPKWNGCRCPRRQGGRVGKKEGGGGKGIVCGDTNRASNN